MQGDGNINLKLGLALGLGSALILLAGILITIYIARRICERPRDEDKEIITDEKDKTLSLESSG
jgi:hypothetical protein